jgi:hypothetical protein
MRTAFQKRVGSRLGGKRVGFLSGGFGAGIGAGVQGAVGIGTSSGLAGSTVGGIAGGAAGGARGYTGNYALQNLAGNKQEWNTSQFFTSMGVGGLLGGAGGALRYGLNPNGVRQEIGKWGFTNNRAPGAVDFLQKEYNISGDFTYSDVPGAERSSSLDDQRMDVRGYYDPKGDRCYIYKNAWFDPGTNNVDASGAIMDMTHEGFHQTSVGSQLLMGMTRQQIEYATYNYTYLMGQQQGLSNPIMEYFLRRMSDFR